MKKICLNLFISLCFLFTCSISFAYKIPNLGSRANTTLNLQQEAELGKEFMKLIKSQLPMSSDPVVIQYIQNLGQRLVSASNKPFRTFHFFVVNDGSINAFAAPGGYIGVNTGTILNAQSESELAAVMAHEIAHVTQRHIARGMAAQKTSQIASIAGMLAAAVLGAINPLAGVAAMHASSAGAAQNSINFTRSHEKEADREGMRILSKAGYSPKAMPAFFKRMQKLEGYSDARTQLPEILYTHPLTGNRVAEAENLANQYTKKKAYRTNNMFYLIQSDLLVQTSAHLQRLKHLLSESKDKNTVPYHYANALLQYRLRDYKKSLDLINQLTKQHPKVWMFQLAKAQILLKNHQKKKSLALFKSLLDKQPMNYAILINYAQSLIQLKEYKKALSILKETNDLFASNEIYLSLLSQAQGRSGQLVEAYMTRAELFNLNGEPKLAMVQLQQAKSHAKTPAQRHQVDFKIQLLKRNNRS
jgi:beta-barrel assembly-enhancing protease